MNFADKAGATQNALLGLLNIRPMSGYDIRQLIPESIGHFWNESYGQIYPALKQMVELGLVEKRTEVQAGRPERHVYTLTVAGRERLREWLAVPVKREPLRSELLLKLFFGSEVSAEVSREHVMAFLEIQEREFATYEAKAKALRQEHARNPQLPFWLITLNRGRHGALAGMAWAKETLAELDRLDERSTPGATSTGANGANAVRTNEVEAGDGA